jgi:hypothetical protein
MAMHWLECVIAIAGKFDRNTSVESVTIIHLAYFATAATKYGVSCVFRQISSLRALPTDEVTAKLFWIIDCTIQPSVIAYTVSR